MHDGVNVPKGTTSSRKAAIGVAQSKRAVVICDKGRVTDVSVDLRSRLADLLRSKGYRFEVVELAEADAAPCRGCLYCLTKHPGRCVTADVVGDLVHRIRVERESCVTVYLTPVLFGHPSSTIKNALDRGTGSHELQVMVGYGDDIDGEEESTFIDITAKHCGASDIVHPGMVRQAVAFVTRLSEDNATICAVLEQLL